MNDLTTDYWVVLSIPHGPKNPASVLSNFDSIKIWYISESWLECAAVVLKKLPAPYGGRLFLSKETAIMRLSPMTVTRILNLHAKDWSDIFDEDHSDEKRNRFFHKLFLDFIAHLMMDKRLDFRKPMAGVQ